MSARRRRTTPPPGMVRVRLVAAPGDVTRAADLIASAAKVTSRSRLIVRSDEPGKASCYLKLRLASDAVGDLDPVTTGECVHPLEDCPYCPYCRCCTAGSCRPGAVRPCTETLGQACPCVADRSVRW